MMRKVLVLSVLMLVSVLAFGQTKVYTVYTNNAQGANSPAMLSDTAVGKEIVKRTGVDLKFSYYVGDANAKNGTLLASGDYPDIIVGNLLPSWIDAGALVPLDDLIKSDAPDIYKGFAKAWPMNKRADGKIYSLPAYVPIGGTLPRLTVDAGWGLPKGAYEKAGFPKIYTVEEYFKFIEDYVKKNPTTPDGQKTIGFEILKDGWRDSPNWMFQDLIATPNDGDNLVVDTKTQKVSIRKTHPGMKQLLKFLNTQYAKGLVDPESFVQTYDQYSAKLASGRVVGIWDQNWEVGDAVASLTKQGKEDRTWFFMPQITWKKGDPLNPNIQGQPNGDGTAITIKAKDPKGIMQFFNKLSSREIQDLIMWGIKGVDYSVDAKGKYTRTAVQMKNASDAIYVTKQGLGILAYPWPSYAGSWPDGNVVRPMDSPELALSTLGDFEKKFVKAWGVKLPGDLYNNKLETSYKWSPMWTYDFGGQEDAKNTANEVVKVYEKYLPLLVTAKPADFEKTWTTYVAEVNKLDVDTLVKVMQKEVDRRMANW